MGSRQALGRVPGVPWPSHLVPSGSNHALGSLVPWIDGGETCPRSQPAPQGCSQRELCPWWSSAPLPSFPRVSSGAVAEGESPARAVPGPALCPRSPAVPRGHWGSVSAPAAAPGGGAGGAAAARDWSPGTGRSWDGDVPAEPAQERERKVWKLQEVPAQHSWLLLARRSATDRTHTLCVTWGTFHPPALDTEPWR